MNFELSLEQKQTITAAQIQSLQLLAMDNLELLQLMQTEYLENPFLEWEGSASATPLTGTAHTPEHTPEIPVPEQVLPKAILSQLNMQRYCQKEWSVICFLTQSLDDNGFLPTPAAELARLTGVSQKLICRLLQDLKQLEPCGIFAKDLRECLLLQWEAGAEKDPLVRELICHHLEALAAGDIKGISKQLRLSTGQIRQALNQILQLNPRPLNGLDTAETVYTIPDLIFHFDPEVKRFSTILNDSWYADYSVSDYYLGAIQKTQDPELQAYFQKKYQRAKWLLEGISLRRKTLLALGNYMAERQFWFLLGKQNRLPVTMTQAAAALAVSVSTISRAVKGKYVQYPGGCIAFKDLFETPIGKAETPELGRDTIKMRLKALIQAEDKHDPLSDSTLVNLLAQEGISVSRRTVAKYRESLGIKGCFQRRQV